MENFTNVTNILSKIIHSDEVIISEEEKIDIINLTKEALEYNGSIKVIDHGVNSNVELFVRYHKLDIEEKINKSGLSKNPKFNQTIYVDIHDYYKNVPLEVQPGLIYVRNFYDKKQSKPFK